MNTPPLIHMKSLAVLLALGMPVAGFAAAQDAPDRQVPKDPITATRLGPAKGARFIAALRAGKKVTIVTMGTSLTGLWPGVLVNDWLNQEWPGQVTLCNEGMGASASSHLGFSGNPQANSGLGKLDAVIAHKPDVVFIEFGVNDAFLPYKISLEESKKNLNTMVDRILEANPATEIILQTMNSVMDHATLGVHATDRPQVAAYYQGYRDVAKARGLLLVDHYPNWLKIMTDDLPLFDRLVPDRIHPQVPGLRQVLLPELKATLCPPPAVAAPQSAVDVLLDPVAGKPRLQVCDYATGLNREDPYCKDLPLTTGELQGGLASGAATKAPAVKQDACELLMIGDSIIDTLHEFGGKYAPLEAVWDKHYAPRHAVDLGHSGIRTEGTLANLEGGEMGGRTPKAAVLLIGTNNSDDRHYPTTHTPEQICEATKAIVASIRRQSPATKVLILRIFPRGGDGEPGVGEGIFHSSEKCIETVRRAGELTAQLADGKQVFWLDINHVFLRTDGSMNTDLMPDLLHPNQAGAEAWAQAIEPTLAQLIGDQPILDPQPNPLLVPATSGGDGTYQWMQRHNSALKAKSSKPLVVFIGDSITHHFGGIPTEGTPPAGQAVWDRLFTRERPAINLGFGADRIQQVLWRLDHGELDGISPKRVVLMVGANHVLGGTEPPEMVVTGIGACLQRIRAKTPEAKITLMAVLPCRNPASHPDRLKVLRINHGLAALARQAQIDFLDLGAKFLDSDGNIPAALMSDAVHPTLAGYQIWGDALAPSLP